jgi:hypothetical protein
MQALVMHRLATWRNERASVSVQGSSTSLALLPDAVLLRLYNAGGIVIVGLNSLRATDAIGWLLTAGKKPRSELSSSLAVFFTVEVRLESERRRSIWRRGA